MDILYLWHFVPCLTSLQIALLALLLPATILYIIYNNRTGHNPDFHSFPRDKSNSNSTSYQMQVKICLESMSQLFQVIPRDCLALWVPAGSVGPRFEISGSCKDHLCSVYG